jgi:hypothetical protein
MTNFHKHNYGRRWVVPNSRSLWNTLSTINAEGGKRIRPEIFPDERLRLTKDTRRTNRHTRWRCWRAPKSKSGSISSESVIYPASVFLRSEWPPLTLGRRLRHFHRNLLLLVPE